MINDIKSILKKLNIADTGIYDDHSYVITLKDSNEYAKMYTTLCETAVNKEYPTFGNNSNKNVIKVTNYFELSDKGVDYNIFLIADFEADQYLLKIKEV